jgi:hypothetical protein
MRPDAPNAPWYLHAYKCEICRGWHLTRQRPRTEKPVCSDASER